MKWLDGEKMAFAFRDVRADGVDADTMSRWIEAAGWETLLNRRGTTWRGLTDAEKDGVDETKAAALMVVHPALIKRPVFEADGKVLVGFKDDVIAALSAAG